MPVYPEIWAGPARNYRRSGGNPVTSSKKYVTIHNTSNDASAKAEAGYAKTRTDGTSSHYYADSNSILQSLDTNWCANHVGSAEGNVYGISYEITGVNGWTRDQWLANVAWGPIARQMARDCAQFGIPVRLLTIAEMKAKNQRGFVTHDMCRIAWGSTTHTDPGPGFPMDHLMSLVRDFLDGDGDDDMDKTDADYLIWRVEGLVRMRDEVAGGQAKGEKLPLTQAVKALIADVAEIKGRSVHLSDGDRIAIADLVSEDVLAKVLPLLDVNAIAAKVADLLAMRLAQ